MTPRRPRPRRLRLIALRKAILEGDALVPLIRADPTSAAALLKLAIIDPDASSGLEGLGRLWGDEGSLEITDVPHWSAPLPENGPFFGFLAHAPDDALRCIVAVVDHATERWATLNRDSEDERGVAEVILEDDPVSLVGDGEVMHWHRGEGRVSSVLSSALMAVEAWLYRRLDNDEDISDALTILMGSRSVAIWGLLTEVAVYRPALLLDQLLPLITSAELLLADSAYRHQPHNHLLIPMLSGRVVAERIRKWHEMPHRTRNVRQFVLGYVLAGEGLVDELAAARDRWQEQDAERLKHLLAQTDPANYRSVELDGGGVEWVYEPPEAVRSEVDESNAEMASANFWLTLPYQLREWIDARQVFTDEELDRFWSMCQERLSQPADAAIFSDNVRSREDVECGVAALLVVCADDWLQRNPDRAKWCRERLMAPFANRPAQHMFDSPQDSATDRWDMFGADALPRLWAEDPDDRELREGIARLAVVWHFNTVARLFSTVDSLSELSGELQRLGTIALHRARWLAWSHEHRARVGHAEQGFGGGPSPDDMPDVESPFRQALEAFEAGTLSSEMPRLADWLASTPDGMIGARMGARHRSLSLVDTEYLLAAFTHLLVLDGVNDGAERSRRLQFAVDLAELVAGGLTPDEGEREIDGMPYESERSALALLGQLTVAVTADEARAIWEPLLAPGVPAAHWVEDYLQAIWRAALAQDTAPPSFVRLIKEILLFASQAQTWLQGGSYSTEIQLAIVGLDRWRIGRPRDSHPYVIADLQPEWGNWVRPRLAGTHYARYVVPFFAEPAADRIYEQAITWLAEHERASAWKDTDLDQALAEMLATLVARHSSLFQGDGATARDARLLLSRVAARGNALALELASRLG